MKITEIIHNASTPLVSLEVLPPVRGTSIESIYNQLDPLMEYNPVAINVTYHRAEQIYKPLPDGNFKRIEVRKRPGTVGICAALMNRYKVEAVPHLICGGFSKEETENALIDLHYLGIDNVLALRGDSLSNEKYFHPHPNGNANAVDLVKQIQQLNEGIYLEEDVINDYATNFCIGVAGYPEKHAEAPNKYIDLKYLKDKIDAGASYVTTQLFYDNEKYFKYVQNCNEIGINAPIIPGLKPITNKKQLSKIPSTFNVDIPDELSIELLKCKTAADTQKVGTEWLIAQSKDLIKNGVPILHYYTLGKPDVILEVLKAIL